MTTREEREIVKPFFMVRGIKNRCRKVDTHVKEFRSMKLDEFQSAKNLIESAWKNYVETNFKAVQIAELSYWPGEIENGCEMFRPLDKVLVVRQTAAK